MFIICFKGQVNHSLWLQIFESEEKSTTFSKQIQIQIGPRLAFWGMNAIFRAQFMKRGTYTV